MMRDWEVHEGEHYTSCSGCGLMFPLRTTSEEDSFDAHLETCGEKLFVEDFNIFE